MDIDKHSNLIIAAGTLLTGFLAIGLGMCLSSCDVWPPYHVWSQEQEGEAERARAEQNRQVQIVQSHAKMEAAEYEAQAEVKRAEGVAQANKIIGDSLKGNDAYLRYLWINQLDAGKNPTVIYVQTETNPPILEAKRLQPQEQK